MPVFDALEEALDEDLTLPMRGADGKTRNYTIKHPTWPEMVRARAMAHIADSLALDREPDAGEVAKAGATGDDDVNLFALGKQTYDAMVKDGVGAETFARATTAALFFRLGNAGQAEAVWSGKAQNSKIRSAKDGDAAKRTTKGSTSGTTTRSKSPKT